MALPTAGPPDGTASVIVAVHVTGRGGIGASIRQLRQTALRVVGDVGAVLERVAGSRAPVAAVRNLGAGVSGQGFTLGLAT
jgi:hypothetical protein